MTVSQIIWAMIHHALALAGSGHWAQASAAFANVLKFVHHRPAWVYEIHHLMYAIHPDWGV